MPTIEYEIKLNDSGRPCIDLSPTYEPTAEDKFFAIELARYLLQETYSRRSPELNKETTWAMDIAIRSLGQIGDEIAKLLWHSMKAAGETTLIFDRWNVYVNTTDERDAIPVHGIIQEGKLYLREEGLIVYVLEGAQRFELKGGTTNDNWVELL